MVEGHFVAQKAWQKIWIDDGLVPFHNKAGAMCKFRVVIIPQPICIHKWIVGQLLPAMVVKSKKVNGID
jgi:hypothetical protein